jgi:DNA modification methylase
MSEVRLIQGDCRDVLPTLPTSSVDCVISDPPYPCIKRKYGTWTEAEWFDLMKVVVGECRRILKPTGSAVFILQPNYERIGKTRLWLWEFMVWAGRKWNLVQDVYWWNITAMPNAGAERRNGLTRRSVKICVWLGPEWCYRNQDAVLLPVSEETQFRQRSVRSTRDYRCEFPSGNGVNKKTGYGVSEKRGGVTPFNLILCRNVTAKDSQDAESHPGMTPQPLMFWWLRYLCPPDGIALDPFHGSGTTALAALKLGRSCIGIESRPEYHVIAERRLATVRATTPLFSGSTS